MPDNEKTPHVIVLGLGNILLKDEGVGVRVIERMQRDYAFPEGVTLFDGATAGLDLMPVIEGYEKVIIVDTVKTGEPPGSIFRFTLDDIKLKVPYKTSLHQIGVVEMFAIAEAMGKKHDAVIIGVQPFDMSSWGLELTPDIEAKVPEIIGLVLGELDALGIKPLEG
ncbi:MAG TPA: HyaD/HybD family hydrogenase maturation endopeptidase [Nitrospirota bacterium]|jgi:hydrogenase maturation protease